MSTCPLCAEALPPGATRCPHCGESFVLPPIQPEKPPLPAAARALAWGLLILALLRLASFARFALYIFGFGVGAEVLPSIAMQLGHTALVVAAGVGLLQARSWAPIAAWLQAGLSLFWLGSYLLSFFGLGLGARHFDLMSMLLLPTSLIVAIMTVIVLLRPDVRAAFRAGT